MYDYFEERGLDQRHGDRKRNVKPRAPAGISQARIDEFIFSEWPWFKTRQMEGRADAPKTEGVWPVNHFRIERYFGDPGKVHCPWHSDPATWPLNVEALARRFRLHHYVRVWNAQECQRIARERNEDVRLALSITEEWFDPPNGEIKEPMPGSPTLGAHSIPIVHFNPETRRFEFTNSWGVQWGFNGWGSFPETMFDRYLIESWWLVGRALEPPIISSSGLVCLLWKSGFGDGSHGREIVDASTGERIAWAFAVRRDDHLDLEELFVWPSHRRKGYARKLAEMVLELAQQMALPLRAWVPFADADVENRDALNAVMRLLGLQLQPSPHQAAAFVATKKNVVFDLAEPTLPSRPASRREELSPDNAPRLYTVWYGTNRQPADRNDMTKGFSISRDTQIHHGTCQVAIPRSHHFGSIGSKWWRRWLRCTDDRLRIVQRTGMTQDQFWAQLSQAMSDLDPEERQGLVFLHGYNVDFDAAAIRAAQIGYDLKVPGATAFFSWPSCGTVAAYPADESCIEASEPYIAEFLQDFVTKSGLSRVHLVAHSMGNRGLLRALQRLGTRLTEARAIPFGQIILAAPDIDAQVFSGLANLYPQFGERTTLYASPADRAVAISQWIHRYPRAGLTPPVTVVPGVDTIEVPHFNVFELLGHGYYAEAEALLHDMFDLIRRNAPPKDRQRLLATQTTSGHDYWIMSR